MQLENGSIYTGPVKDGMMNGYGTLEFKNGEKYVGDFVNDKAHGKGKHTWPSGE